MLKLKNIKKDYGTTEAKVHALKGINIEFRKSEFVSILGQSGCGKTTLLNIIGGLDRYTSGDLVINGKSTKNFKNKDWDAYRNYSVGFVFQSYNLIPHQTILSNVELALTLSGVSKTERKKRAIKALEDVGLKEQINKRPNQLSGGQMQRVAIARALVNNPDIILADEPTGALDTSTSVQIMEILKKISEEKLIVMVTHNPELADKYSTRIVKILDGVITDDSNPYTKKDEKKEKDLKAKTGKTTMGIFTAAHLSLNNLMTKKGRTLLTAFAGSIGIIGIALILSISSGVQKYINNLEEDTLSSYPISIQESTMDISTMMESMMGEQEIDRSNYEKNKIYSSDIMGNMIKTLSDRTQQNNLEELKKYIDNGNNAITENMSAVQYGYNTNINIYKEDTTNGVVQVNPSTVMDKMSMGEMANIHNEYTTIEGDSTNVWAKQLSIDSLIESQYSLIAGDWSNNYDEVMLVVDQNGEISDYTLYSLGLLDQTDLKNNWNKVEKGESVEETNQTSYTYDELLNLKFKLLLDTDYYEKESGLWINKNKDEEYLKNTIKKAEEIKVSGIIQLKSDSVTSTMGGIIYTDNLEKHIIEKINESQIVKEQKENKDINIFTGLKFPSEDQKTSFDYNNLTPEQKLAISNMSMEEVSQMMQTYTDNEDATYESNLEKLGSVELEKPKTISLYAADFELKNKITSAIEEYNQKQRDDGKEENVISYTDMVGILMKSVTQIVDVISYVLIAFVSISLIVSSIMIGIITYISVLERTKEIGILRAMGASKKDISRVFNAETFIIGLVSGLLGIGMTILLDIPITALVSSVTGVKVSVALSPVAGIILVAISMVLTIIAGLIPSKMAAKKDPVEALRSE